jgi:hypothetical protein
MNKQERVSENISCWKLTVFANPIYRKRSFREAPSRRLVNRTQKKSSLLRFDPIEAQLLTRSPICAYAFAIRLLFG